MSKKNNNGQDPEKYEPIITWGEIYGKVSKVDGINVGPLPQDTVGPLPQDTSQNDAMQKTVDKANNGKTLMENVSFDEFSPPIPKDASEEHYQSITKDFKK